MKGRDADVLDDLIARFDQVQLAFGPHPGRCAQIAARVLAQLPDTGPDRCSARRSCVVELGCGTATLLASLDDGACRLGVEADPVLLQLARRVPGVKVVDGDFRSPAWLTKAGVRPGEIDVVLAARALHYPDPAELLGVYAYLAHWLRPGGVLVNADRFDVVGATAPLDDRTALTAWSQWWDDARAHPALAGAFRERDQRAGLGTGNRLTPAAHVAMLQSSGFASVEVVRLDVADALVVAVH